MAKLLGVLRQIVTGVDGARPDLEPHLAELRAKVPAPVFWLIGKTQSGKTSIIRHLTGADDAAIGSGFRPCTRTSRMYHFPTPDAPLASFLDTRGIDEPGYNPSEDIAEFADKAHVLIVTVKATDFAQGNVRAALEPIRRAAPDRPVVLAITCLHEAFPRQPHPQPYAFRENLHPQLESPYDSLLRLIEEHRRAFEGLYDAVVPLDLTRPEEGFDDQQYGGEFLKETLLNLLPEAYRQSLLRLKEATDLLKDVHLRAAVPVILGYSSLAATAGAIPVPFVDLLLLSGIHTRMVTQLAQLYGQPLTAKRFREIAASMGLGIVTRQATRELMKLIPWVGSAVGAAMAWATTYALGRAFCFYYEAVCEGHVPDAASLKTFYKDQLARAAEQWKATNRREASGRG